MRKGKTMTSSTQRKIGKVRAPRVHLTYDVEKGDGIQERSLPFVLGVLADLQPSGTPVKLKDRTFTEIGEDNFDQVMTAMRPTLALRVPNKLTGDGEMRVDLTFCSLEAFTPGAIAAAVPQLAQLLEARAGLNDLLAKLEGNDRLDELLAEVVGSTELQDKARGELAERRAASVSKE
jgi:type VI secretion system protein ImpB